MSTLKSSEAMLSVFEDVFPDIETMHIFDEEKRKMIKHTLGSPETLLNIFSRCRSHVVLAVFKAQIYC